MERWHGRGDHAGEKKWAPVRALANREPQDDEHDQRQAEAEQRRPLRDEICEHRVEPLEVDVAVQGVLAHEVSQRAGAGALHVAEQVHESETPAQQEQEDRDRGGGASGCKSPGGEVDHRGQSEHQHRRRRGQRLGQRRAERHEIGGEEVDHERVAEVVARIDGELGREVAAVRKRPGIAEVCRPVAPDVDVAGVKPL